MDQTNTGDEIRVAAGTYTGVNNYGGLAQVVYVDKSITIRGGYTTSNWTTPDPQANPTTLDAQGQGRVLYITGSIAPTIEGLRITGGCQEPDVNVPSMFTKSTPRMFTRNAPGMFTENVPPMFGQNAPPVQVSRACPEGFQGRP